MSSKAKKKKRDETPAAVNWQMQRETAPSLMREDEPALARMVGLLGLALVVVGIAVHLFTQAGLPRLITPAWANFFLTIGIAALLMHAVADKDMQVRRLYGCLGMLLLAAGIGLCIWPVRNVSGPIVYGALFGYGFLGLLLALLFLLAFVRNESDPEWRKWTTNLLGSLGIIGALTGFVGGNIWKAFLLPHGLLLAGLALAYLWAFVSLRGTSDDLGYRTGRWIALFGLLVFLVALGRATLPPLLYSLRWITIRPEPYLTPYGILVMGAGLLYTAVGVTLYSEWRLVVMTRRELAAYFYSPIAYLVLLGFTVVGWLMYLLFILDLSKSTARGEPLMEPILRGYILSFIPVFSVLFVVPMVTMRLFSEEKRTGTLEQLLTAPLDEMQVVVSKFLAAWVFFIVLWIPWGLFLVALRMENSGPFEYHPLITFFIVLACTGAGFISMGLFFSSLTRNQIVAAVLTFAGMLFYLVAFFVKQILIEIPRGPGQVPSPWINILKHVNFIDLWFASLLGMFTPQYLVFFLSVTAFWLFSTIKVLEARKWR